MAMVVVAEVKNAKGEVLASHEGPASEIAKVSSEAVAKYWRANPTELASLEGATDYTISLRHYFK